MDKNEIFFRVVEVFKTFFDDRQLQINIKTTNEMLEDWDSVAHIQLVFELEEEFDIQFEAEEIVNLNSIEKIVDAIEKMI